MYAGRIVEQAPGRGVFDSPAHPYSAALAAAFPTIGDPASRRAPAGLPGDPPYPGELPPGCTFAPRCAHAAPECLVAEPALRPTGADRVAACVRIGADGGPLAQEVA
jgi:peptide/nickel transport system ATP-binding protein